MSSEHVAHLQRMANESWIGSPERAALDAAIAALSAPQPPAEAHCATCSCVPGMTPAVRFDATPAEKGGAVRDHLIRMGWTPPAEAKPAPYNRKRIAWELERTAMGDGYYGGALRAAREFPEATPSVRSLLDRWATGKQSGLSDQTDLCTFALQIYAADGESPQPPAEAQPDWEAAPPGATHYQPHQDAYYKRVSASEWYVWSRVEDRELLRWLPSPGTSDSAEWVVRPTDAHPSPSAPVGVEDAEVWLFKGTDGAWHTFHNEQHRLDTIADGRWEVRKFTALPQQPAAVGEEIMVNAAHDVYTLPLQPSGLSSGPRFVVHVPAPEQPAAVDDLTNAWRAAFVEERATRYREGGMKIEQARIHAETDAARIAALAQQPAADDSEQFRRGWQAGMLAGRASVQPAAVDEVISAARAVAKEHDGPLETIIYDSDDDEAGDRVCCRVRSYEPHAEGCPLIRLRAALAAQQGGRSDD